MFIELKFKLLIPLLLVIIFTLLIILLFIGEILLLIRTLLFGLLLLLLLNLLSLGKLLSLLFWRSCCWLKLLLLILQLIFIYSSSDLLCILLFDKLLKIMFVIWLSFILLILLLLFSKIFLVSLERFEFSIFFWFWFIPLCNNNSVLTSFTIFWLIFLVLFWLSNWWILLLFSNSTSPFFPLKLFEDMPLALLFIVWPLFKFELLFPRFSFFSLISLEIFNWLLANSLFSLNLFCNDFLFLFEIWLL